MQRGLDYIGVGVGALIADETGRVFLARRGPQARNERGLWEFPGGSVEFGERLADALKREMLEEYGVEIAVDELLDVVDHILPDEGQHWVSPSFICSTVSGEPALREPVQRPVERGVFDHELLARRLPDPRGHCVAVARAPTQRLEDDEVERALEQLDAGEGTVLACHRYASGPSL